MLSSSPLRDALLDAALQIAVFDGWNVSTLASAAHRVSCDEASLHMAFPNGVADMLAYFSARTDQAMVAQLAEQNLSAMKVRQRIATAVRTRLTILEEHKEAERRAVAYHANPLHAPAALGLLYKTVDEMWYQAGDTSTDFNFYTKRLLLAKVYTSTLLFWLGDTSEHHSESWEFLDRRIENVMQIEKWKAKAKLWAGGLSMPDFRAKPKF